MGDKLLRNLTLCMKCDGSPYEQLAEEIPAEKTNDELKINHVITICQHQE